MAKKIQSAKKIQQKSPEAIKQQNIQSQSEETNKENIFTWFGIIIAAFATLGYVMFIKN